MCDPDSGRGHARAIHTIPCPYIYTSKYLVAILPICLVYEIASIAANAFGCALLESFLLFALFCFLNASGWVAPHPD